MATEIHLSRTFADKSKIDVTASPHAFRVRSSVPLVSDRHPGRYTQDTLYHEINKTSAKKFYAWLQKNLARADRMTISEFREASGRAKGLDMTTSEGQALCPRHLRL